MFSVRCICNILVNCINFDGTKIECPVLAAEYFDPVCSHDHSVFSANLWEQARWIAITRYIQLSG